MNTNNKAKKFVAKTLESILVIGYILFEELVWNIFAKPIYSYIKKPGCIRTPKTDIFNDAPLPVTDGVYCYFSALPRRWAYWQVFAFLKVTLSAEFWFIY
ncbi:MAG: hypothetical protein H0A75_05480 [Candidatus Methanofishera endochildressiae]|uniref:Uncharacterized protein n=1 Tax=Candidatus Methanofishera endochildressiae TaxID=2738884 RepID=A0A7Z0MNU6_9GAMM|nr:hypothetical protein [Candidatus Methanofishera endochildressiae]